MKTLKQICAYSECATDVELWMSFSWSDIKTGEHSYLQVYECKNREGS